MREVVSTNSYKKVEQMHKKFLEAGRKHNEEVLKDYLLYFCVLTGVRANEDREISLDIQNDGNGMVYPCGLQFDFPLSIEIPETLGIKELDEFDFDVDVFLSEDLLDCETEITKKFKEGEVFTLI